MLSKQPRVYYPPETDLKSYLFIEKVCRDRLFDSYNKSGRGVVPLNHGLDYILDGEGYFFDSKGKKVKFAKNDIIITPKDIWYDYKPLSGKSFESLWFRFNGQLADDLMSFFAGRNINIIKLRENERIKQFFLEIFEFGKVLTVDNSTKATGLLTALLTELKALTVNDQSSVVKSKSFIESFYQYARHNYNVGKLDLKPFLEEHGLGYESFRKKFKKAAGIYPYSYWLECKINKAKAYLEYSSKSISEISYALGYDNVFAFSSFFKAKTGFSPTEYRNKHVN